MSRRPIVLYPEPVLQRRASEASAGARLDALIDELLDTLAGTSGVGLAAPQIGVPLRVFVLDVPDVSTPQRVFVNPLVVKRSGLAITLERCLSLPGIAANVARASRVQLQAMHGDGTPFECELDGFAAVCAQHEIDHLDGRLFTDRLSAPRRWLQRNRLNALRRDVAQVSLPAEAG